MIKVGCDIVELARVEKALHKEAFLRILTTAEKAQFHQLKPERAIEWLAGQFAAKEAVYKAVHTMHPCFISQLEILRDETGAPYCQIEGLQIELSISHEGHYAVAFAVAEIQA